MSTLQEYAQARELTLNLTLRELRGKYKRSVLGWTWSLLNPLSTVVIYSIVFAVFLKVEPPTGRPERAPVLRAVPPVRPAAVELLRRSASTRVDGLADRRTPT